VVRTRNPKLFYGMALTNESGCRTRTGGARGKYSEQELNVLSTTTTTTTEPARYARCPGTARYARRPRNLLQLPTPELPTACELQPVVPEKRARANSKAARAKQPKMFEILRVKPLPEGSLAEMLDAVVVDKGAYDHKDVVGLLGHVLMASSPGLLALAKSEAVVFKVVAHLMARLPIAFLAIAVQQPLELRPDTACWRRGLFGAMVLRYRTWSAAQFTAGAKEGADDPAQLGRIEAALADLGAFTGRCPHVRRHGDDEAPADCVQGQGLFARASGTVHGVREAS
jgi:hypothetical protein